MITLYSPEQIDAIREGGAILSRILEELVDMVKPGVNTADLEAHSTRRMHEAGGEPSFKGYRSDPSQTPYNSSVCTSINDEVVHAPAIPGRVVKEGDILKLDIGLRYKTFCTDMAVTVPVGKADKELLNLIAVTKDSMLIGISKIRAGGWISDIGKAVDKRARRAGYATVKDLTGHGVGNKVHEEPCIPNYFDDGMEPVRMKEGMVLAVEPMLNIGEEDVVGHRDGWTISTEDKTYSAHFEVTVAITDKGMEIMTPVPKNV
ncbi:MAG: hypothetical protein RLZZ324_962 [Candidatus Parcubacteria bacterium]|jgi:methionyl aminopeptidase